MNTGDPNICPECGIPVPPESQHRLCPACLMAQALAPRTMVSDATEGTKGPSQCLPPPSPEDIAANFPQFEIRECLGHGGMGVVYKATQKSLNRTVAIKILAPGREHDARFAERFAREAELLAKLSHPHIVTIHDFGQASGLFYLVMEFVDGVNLRDLLRDGKLEPKQALAIVPPICEALQYAHDKGIVHRDIKPENILLDREGRVKIADFGIAALIGAEGEPAGTPSYMAPEQHGNRPEVDHRADIYALGVVLYEMLTGERPEREVIAPSRKVQIDVRLDEVVLRALEKKPELRYQQASEVQSLVETIATTPVAPPPAIQIESPPDSRVPFAVLALLYLTLVAGLIRTGSWLPDRVATHFGLEGTPDGWMGRTAYLLFVGALPAVLALVFGVMAHWVRYPSAVAFINIPNRAYWLAPERRPFTAAVIRNRLTWLLAMLTLLFGGLHGLTVAANQGHPPRLPMGALLLLVMVFLISAILWITALLTRFAETYSGGGTSPTRPFAGFPTKAAKALLAIALALLLHTFVIAPYVATTDAVSPELPRESYVLVFRLARSFAPGDILVYCEGKTAMLGRVTEKGPRDGKLMISRQHVTPRPIPVSQVAGKVIFNTRPSVAPSVPGPSLSSGPATIQVEVRRSRGMVTVTGMPDASLVVGLGNAWLRFGLIKCPDFTAVIDRAWFGGELNCVIRDSRGHVLSASRGFRIGLMIEQQRGQVVLPDGTRQPEPDGSYVIGEFKPETGTPLPLTLRVELPDRPSPP